METRILLLAEFWEEVFFTTEDRCVRRLNEKIYSINKEPEIDMLLKQENYEGRGE